MGVSIAKGQTFLGLPLTAVRDVLLAWNRPDNRNAWTVAARTGLPPWTSAVIIEEAKLRGLIHPTRILDGERSRGNLTEAGLLLATARAMKRTQRAKALRVFENFLDGCEAINRRDDLPFEVEQVWVFGSILDEDKRDVGDIDFVPVIRNAKLRPGTDTHGDWYWDLARELGVERQVTLSNLYELVESRILYGGRRHFLFAPTHLHDLHSLACRCRLVFDAARGGRVDDAVLPMHPDARKRDDTIGSPKSMPGLEPTDNPIVPVAASLIVPELSPDHATRKAYFLGGEHQGKVSLFAWYDPFRTGVLTDGVEPRDAAGVGFLKELDLRGCDDRGRVGLFVPGEERSPGCGVILERRIHRAGDVVRYVFEIQQYAQDGADTINECSESLTFALHAVLQADIERIFRLDAEAGVETRLQVEISSRSEHPAANCIADDLEANEDVVVWQTADRTGHEPIYDIPRWDDDALSLEEAALSCR